MFFVEIIDGLLKRNPAFYAISFIESCVGFIGYSQIMCSINDGFVESKNRVFFLEQKRWDFIQIYIESNTKKGLFLSDLLRKLLCCHFCCMLIRFFWACFFILLRFQICQIFRFVQNQFHKVHPNTELSLCQGWQ